MTRLEDAREAVRVGAWAIGLIHHDASPRRVDPAVAAEIGAELRRKAEVVGVFVNAGLDAIVAAAEDESLTMLQLHGDEGPAFCQEAARRTGCRVIKAMRVRSAADIQAAEAFRTDYHLFDAHREGMRGGTGESFDWELLARRSSAVPAILSGGLRPGNVAEAIAVGAALRRRRRLRRRGRARREGPRPARRVHREGPARLGGGRRPARRRGAPHERSGGPPARRRWRSGSAPTAGASFPRC